MNEPHPFTFLLQEEFKLCFSVAFLETTDSFSGSYEIHRYASPGERGPTSDWLELFYRAIRFLALEKGYEFSSLDVARDGRITSAGPVEPGNVMYVTMFREGGLPNLPLAFETAIRLAEDEIPSLDTEPLKAALAQVRRDLKRVKVQGDPMVEYEREKFRDEALRSVGVVRNKEIVH